MYTSSITACRETALAHMLGNTAHLHWNPNQPVPGWLPSKQRKGLVLLCCWEGLGRLIRVRLLQLQPSSCVHPCKPEQKIHQNLLMPNMR